MDWTINTHPEKKLKPTTHILFLAEIVSWLYTRSLLAFNILHSRSKSLGIWRSVQWQQVTDFSGKIAECIFRIYTVQVSTAW